MEKINNLIHTVLRRVSPTDLIPNAQSSGWKKSESYSGTINALDCIGREILEEDIFKAEALLILNYGVDYPGEKLALLWTMIMEEGWTNERLMRTVKWVMKTKKYPNWTIADFFEYEIKLHPYSWYLAQIHNGVKHDEMIAYKVNEKFYWTMNDGTELPLERA